MTEAPPNALPVAEILREMRAAVGSLRAAAETLEGFPDVERALRDRLLAVLGEEALRLSDRMHALETAVRRTDARSEPASAPLPELLRALGAALTALGLHCALEPLPADLAQARVALAPEPLCDEASRFFAALRRGSRVGGCGIRARAADRHARIDLFWSPEPSDLAWLLGWQGEALGAGPPGQPAGGLRAVARAADGAAWFTLDRDGESAHLLLLLPLAGASS